MPRLRLTSAARRDLANVLRWSTDHFGVSGRDRYEALLQTALRDIATEPDRHGSREVRGLGRGRRLYHVRLSRDRAGRAGKVVRSPRHILIYRHVQEDDAVVVLRVLHDAMEPDRHVVPRHDTRLD